METPVIALPRRRRSVAFFEPIADESEIRRTESDDAFAKKAAPTPPGTTSTKVLFLSALPILLLLVYILTPKHQPSPYTSTTPFTPLLNSLTAQLALSPALPYIGLAMYTLRTNISKISDVPSDLAATADRAQNLIEAFSGMEYQIKAGLHEILDEFVEVADRLNSSKTKEGYEKVFKILEGNLGGLVQSSGELGLVLGQLKGEVGAYEREVKSGNDIMGKTVEWVGMLVGRADKGYKDVLAKAMREKKVLSEMPDKGGMVEGLVKREVAEIQKYRELDREAEAVVDAIGVELMEGEVEGMVQGKLEAAIAKREIDWW